ncbi:hypothetical protein DKX38_010197 [Salix brachista]|uniref:Calreticulin n=1 Tax=Salix brachista TaxID=2182728 RepID=A0A5N5MFJ3_9ROSI|nr:hypothetical protein DKX38_010197 [Salix brachista]
MLDGVVEEQTFEGTSNLRTELNKEAAASSFEKDFQEMQEMLQQLKLEKEKTEVLLKEKDEMLKAKDDEIEMKGKEQEKMKSEFQKLEIERLAQIERAQRHVESLYSDWDLLPPKTIKDPEAKKPEDWDDEEDGEWKPEDWDDEEDGEWTAPTISNTEYKGPWKPKKIKNPNYQGKWKAQIVSHLTSKIFVLNEANFTSNTSLSLSLCKML